MIGIAIFLLAQVAAPTVETRAAASRSYSPTYPYELRNQVSAYLSCLRGDGLKRPQNNETFQAVFQRDIDRCDQDAQEQTVEAFKVWKVGKDEESARAYVTNLFVSLREHHLERGVALDRLNAEKSESRQDPSDD